MSIGPGLCIPLDKRSEVVLTSTLLTVATAIVDRTNRFNSQIVALSLVRSASVLGPNNEMS
jgi:hypothetical protein